jgi:anti-sigma-K factor RskA
MTLDEELNEQIRRMIPANSNHRGPNKHRLSFWKQVWIVVSIYGVVIFACAFLVMARMGHGHH